MYFMYASHSLNMNDDDIPEDGGKKLAFFLVNWNVKNETFTSVALQTQTVEMIN